MSGLDETSATPPLTRDMLAAWEARLVSKETDIDARQVELAERCASRWRLRVSLSVCRSLIALIARVVHLCFSVPNVKLNVWSRPLRAHGNGCREDEMTIREGIVAAREDIVASRADLVAKREHVLDTREQDFEQKQYASPFLRVLLF